MTSNIMAPEDRIPLRYGCNPHQIPSALKSNGQPLPLRVVNGAPSYINVLDAITAWQLVRDLKAATGKASAASFKHVNPAGVAVTGPLDACHRASLEFDADTLSPAAVAYVRARGADPLASFGDAVAISERVDESLARVLSREVSDLIVAPGFDDAALKILKGKQSGRYLILEMDPNYEPSATMRISLFGVELEQPLDTSRIDASLFSSASGNGGGSITAAITETLIVATLAAKYAISNSVCVAFDGQAIGIGAGQQSRVDCVRLACAKAEKWLARRHPRTLALPIPKELPRPERTNLIDSYLRHEELSEFELRALNSRLSAFIEPLDRGTLRAWNRKFDGLCLSSDGFFPFRDSIDRAAAANIQFVAHPGGSRRDADVEAAAIEHGIHLISTGIRCFRH